MFAGGGAFRSAAGFAVWWDGSLLVYALEFDGLAGAGNRRHWLSAEMSGAVLAESGA